MKTSFALFLTALVAGFATADLNSLAVDTEVNVEGVENCLNKCNRMFNTQQYAINVQQFRDTYEYSACRAGCAICNAVINSGTSDKAACAVTCKNTDWSKNKDIDGNPFPIYKGVVEPDKACQFGCIIGTCQYVCQGGTPDNSVTPENKNLWWDPDAGTTGCSIKTGAIRPGGYYSQNGQYNQYNSPSGVGGVSDCCSNLMSLCQYTGKKNTSNFKQVLGQARKHCKDVPGVGTKYNQMCNYFNDATNCGSSL